MFLAVVAALAMSGAAAAPPASAAGGQISPATPLREVVYKVSYTRRLEVSGETYGGQILNPINNAAVQAPAFNESNNNATDSGTVTVDIMQISDNALGMRVSERWTGSTPSGTYLGNVASDGSVNFNNGQMNECTRSILEYFGTDVMAGQPANSGVAWSRAAKGQAADVVTTYSVGDIVGAIANIHELSTVTSKSVAAIDTTITTDVQYKPAVLVPVSGKVVLHARSSGASSVTNVTTVANFQRVSDSRDPSP
ncbi:MAG TPA: hypothetical protein VKT51_07545 [Candidatus Eremiobacteraceae bacterium]|nr:hypothetical protein [Candidatus Eremiobacteraceae bacterium]